MKFVVVGVAGEFSVVHLDTEIVAPLADEAEENHHQQQKRGLSLLLLSKSNSTGLSKERSHGQW